EQAQPQACPWREFDIDVVLECTGVFRAYEDARQHLGAGAGGVVVGAVPFDRADDIVVYGVNHAGVDLRERVVSAASCTTHCIAPLLAALSDAFGVEQALMKEVHAYTSDQSLLDHVHRDLRRGRAAAQNIVPTTSSAIGAVQKVLPWMQGRISGDSIRVPTLNVALVDLTLKLGKTPTEVELNQLFEQVAEQSNGLIGFNTEPLVSSDFIHRAESAIVDATQTRVQGDMVHLVAWYDNEWGYANRLLDLLAAVADQRATGSCKTAEASKVHFAQDGSGSGRQARTDPRRFERSGQGRQGDVGCAYPGIAADYRACDEGRRESDADVTPGSSGRR